MRTPPLHPRVYPYPLYSPHTTLDVVPVFIHCPRFHSNLTCIRKPNTSNVTGCLKSSPDTVFVFSHDSREFINILFYFQYVALYSFSLALFQSTRVSTLVEIRKLYSTKSDYVFNSYKKTGSIQASTTLIKTQLPHSWIGFKSGWVA